MDIIHLLPDSVANQIAAGEVIQRPASCLKELVENSLDAGATDIKVLLYDSGRTMMQVIDNGKGMSETDARMAFERHATSKIKSADDLFALHTMGFRGEALASICAVAQVELLTCREEDEIGTRLEIHGSEVKLQEPCSCAKGTNIKVKNLFYNVPARRRFLKTDATELRNIIQEFYRIVLVNPQCRFCLTNNDELLLDLTAGNIKHRIEQVFGKSLNKQFTAGLVEIKSETDIVEIHGFVGKPEFAGKQAQQYFFVNNRYMRHPYFHKAIMTAYQGMLQPDQQPSYFIYFDVRPETIDVNIHPTKTEIKFSDEQPIWQILLATVRESLGKFNVVPSLDFDSEAGSASIIDIPQTATRGEMSGNFAQHDSGYNPFNEKNSYQPQWVSNNSNRASSYADRKQPVQGWEKLYDNIIANAIGKEGEESGEGERDALFDVDLSQIVPFQLAGKYIVLPLPTGLFLLHQHRVHLSVMYENITAMLRQKRIPSQQLLFPEVIDMSAEECSLMSEAEEELRQSGFEFSQFSPSAYSLSGIPAIMDGHDAVAVIRRILASISDAGLSARATWQHLIALSLAADAAIPSGKPMSEAEMRSLVEQLLTLDNQKFTPDGKQMTSIIPLQDIEKIFRV